MRLLRQFGYPTREGIYFLAMLGFVFTGAILREINMMLLIGGLMVGPIIYNILAARRSIWKLKLQRTLPAGIHAGQVAVIGCQLESKSSLRNVTLHEQIKHARFSSDKRQFDIPVPQRTKRGNVSFSYHVKPSRRGYYQFDGGYYSTSAPLGFWKNSQPIAEMQQWLVWPEIGRLRDRSIPGLQGVPSISTSRGQAMASQQGDYAGLRTWQMGDRRRDVHWRSSARRGELLVKQYDDRTEREWTLVLDLTVPDASSIADFEQVEYAICMAATLIDHYQKKYQGRLTLVTVGAAMHIQTGQTQHRYVNSLYEHLAVVEAGNKITTIEENELPQLKKQLLSVQPLRALLISVQNPAIETAKTHPEPLHALNESLSFLSFLKTNQIWTNCHFDQRATSDPAWQKMFSWNE